MKQDSPARSPLLAPPIPAARASQVWLDFDGTITQQDVLDALIVNYARDDSWKLIEERWRVGQIGSRQCLSEEFALVDISEPELAAFLQTIQLDPGIVRLVNVLREHDVPVRIVSDGVEQFIRPILGRAGLGDVPVRCNRITHEGRSLTLDCPFASHACESKSAHCKCSSIKATGDRDRADIYVGDGRSDLCAARKAKIVFAKGVLATTLAGEGVPFFPFQTLDDVAAVLLTAWSPRLVPEKA